jgi:hypothetical protein
MTLGETIDFVFGLINAILASLGLAVAILQWRLLRRH